MAPDPTLIAHVANQLTAHQKELLNCYRSNYEALGVLVERMIDTNAKFARILDPLELGAKDFANQEQQPIQLPALCLTCKTQGSIRFSKIPGVTNYELTVPEGWMLELELKRKPMTVFLLCPQCTHYLNGGT
jgi:hypothetical protein